MFSRRLVRELMSLVMLKLLLLAGIYFAFFSPAHRTPVSGPEVASRLLPVAPPVSATAR